MVVIILLLLNNIETCIRHYFRYWEHSLVQNNTKADKGMKRTQINNYLVSHTKKINYKWCIVSGGDTKLQTSKPEFYLG